MSVQPKTLIRPPVIPMATNMRHVVQLVLPLTQFVATLSRPLSWSDFVNLLPLKRLDKHERQPGEEAPIGLILCAESRTKLPPKAELNQKLHTALLEARERLVRRTCLQKAKARRSQHRYFVCECADYSEVGSWEGGGSAINLALVLAKMQESNVAYLEYCTFKFGV